MEIMLQLNIFMKEEDEGQEDGHITINMRYDVIKLMMNIR